MPASPRQGMQGPLSANELAELEATLLPALERHHLRLLAHGLRTLQAIAARREGSPPDRTALNHWACGVPQLSDDPSFRHTFLDQLEAAGRQLESIASGLGSTALALELPELCRSAKAAADQRLRIDDAGS